MSIVALLMRPSCVRFCQKGGPVTLIDSLKCSNSRAGGRLALIDTVQGGAAAIRLDAPAACPRRVAFGWAIRVGRGARRIPGGGQDLHFGEGH